MLPIVFYEVFVEEERELKKLLPQGCQAIFRQDTIQSYQETHHPASLISIRTQSRIPDSWLTNLKGILTRSSGFDHLVPLLSWRKRGVHFGYLPSYCAPSVAEHAILVAMALLHKFKKQLEHFHSFNRNDLTGRTCQNKTMLVVGVGKIGSEIVRLAEMLGLRVRGVDLVPRLSSLSYVSLEEGLPWADLIVCALPLTDKTRGLLDYKMLRQAKQKAVFVNISRGEISPVADLQRLLEENLLAGIGLDVYEEEANLAAFLQGKQRTREQVFETIVNLKDRDDVIFTPHNAFNTEDDLESKAHKSWEAIRAFCNTGAFPDQVPEEL